MDIQERIVPRRSRRRLLILAALPIVVVAGGMATTISCKSVPVILTSRSDAAAKRLTVELVRQDGGASVIWSGPLGPDDWRIIHVPLLIDGFYHNGFLRYGGSRLNGEPIPETIGPGYLTSFPDNKAAIFVLGKDETTAMSVREWFFPEHGSQGLLSVGWFVDQILVVLSCWWRWLAGSIGFAVAGGLVVLATWWLRRRKTASQ